ncbi:MAG: hypothetical protein Unbinned1606contig1000_30 [Prokaryotic dsDNA virus sp.]|nr:MAG: hypothetical protein Unbinned1606contig1000_30 [Prokaryotic dsDNA virus sp.]
MVPGATKDMEKGMDINNVTLTGTVSKKTLRAVGAKDTPLLEIVLEQEIKDWRGQPTMQPVIVQKLGRQAEEYDVMVKEGQKVRVDGSLDGRKWEDRIFINCTVQRITVEDEAPDSEPAMDQQQLSGFNDEEVPF